MTDRRAALDEVHQSLHEEYHVTMTRDDIIRMAREAGFEFKDRADPRLERFAELVAEREREACARVCEEIADSNDADGYFEWVTGNIECAQAIRARGQ